MLVLRFSDNVTHMLHGRSYLMICTTYSVWLAKMSQTDTHFKPLLPTPYPVLALKLIGNLSEEDLKEVVSHSASALHLMSVRLF